MRCDGETSELPEHVSRAGRGAESYLRRRDAAWRAPDHSQQQLRLDDAKPFPIASTTFDHRVSSDLLPDASLSRPQTRYSCPPPRPSPCHWLPFRLCSRILCRLPVSLPYLMPALHVPQPLAQNLPLRRLDLRAC